MSSFYIWAGCVSLRWMVRREGYFYFLHPLIFFSLQSSYPVMQCSYFWFSASQGANVHILDHVWLGKLFRPTMFMDHVWIASQAAIFLDILVEYSIVSNCLPIMSFSIFVLLARCSSIAFCCACKRVYIRQFLFTSKEGSINKKIVQKLA